MTPVLFILLARAFWLDVLTGSTSYIGGGLSSRQHSFILLLIGAGLLFLAVLLRRLGRAYATLSKRARAENASASNARQLAETPGGSTS